MREIIGGFIAAYLAIAGMMLVPLYTFNEWRKARNCASIHNVYACEKVETWIPISTTKEKIE